MFARTAATAALNVAWYLRNAMSFAKRTQIARPGDRVIAEFRAGHACRLHQFVEPIPGFQLVEPDRDLVGAKQ